MIISSMERISFPISLHGNGSQHGRHGEFRQCATLSPFSGVQRLTHEIGQDALFPTERFITNMERNIDGPSSLCGSAQSTNTLPHSMAGTTRASALTSQPPRYTVHGKGVLTPPARKVNNDDVRLRQTPFHAPFWNSKPTLPVGCWDPMLEPNAGCLPSATFPSAMPIRQNGEWYQEIHQVFDGF